MADTMETYSCLVNLGGERDQQVQKENVTVGEIAVLRAIHGEDAVTELQKTGSVERTNKQERERLQYFYADARDRGDKNVLGTLFPGIGARVPTKADELDLRDEYFAAEKKKGRNRAEDDEDEDASAARRDAELAEVRAKDEVKAEKATEKAVKAGKNKRSAATGTGLLGKADAADPRPPIGKGGAGSLGSKGGIDGEGTKPDANADEDADDGADDLIDAHTEKPIGDVLK